MNIINNSQSNIKTCTKCKQPKLQSEFYKNKLSSDGLCSQCKQCRKTNYDDTRKNIINISNKTCNRCNINKSYLDFSPNRLQNDGLNKCCKSCNNLNDRINKRSIKYVTNRRKTDLNFKLKNNIRNRINLCIKRGSKTSTTVELLGCTICELRHHLEKQFKEGMTWNNHGFGKDKWHIDHIIPCANFDLTDPIQQQTCFNYTNLQPLWQHENIIKSNKTFIRN